MRLKKLTVKNFKSLRDCEIELGKFNVLVGANASGKTNLVEVFKLLRKIYVERDTNPFLEWWGYNNVVWAGKEELPITVGMLFDVEGYDVYFETTFTGTGGSFRILKEVLEIRNYMKIEKEGRFLTINHDKNWLEMALSELKTVEDRDFLIYKHFANLSTLDLEVIEKELPASFVDKSLLKTLPGKGTSIYDSQSKVAYTISEIPYNSSVHRIPIVSPTIKWGQHETISPLYWEFGILMNKFLWGPIILRQIFIKELKTPQYPRKEATLKEDASNLIPFLYNIWLREGMLPEKIAKPLSIAFPDTRVFFQLTEDGRVMMKVFENDLELAPPGISDGFYKVLALLTAVYSKPPLLIIDEIENSLHPETLELIIDTLRESESQVIITTHSPVVVDIVEPSDLVLVDKEEGETVFRRIKDPEKIKKSLNEKGITLSEGWLYGSLFESDDQ